MINHRQGKRIADVRASPHTGINATLSDNIVAALSRLDIQLAGVGMRTIQSHPVIVFYPGVRGVTTRL